jgi:hypothetical protein
LAESVHLCESKLFSVPSLQVCVCVGDLLYGAGGVPGQGTERRAQREAPGDEQQILPTAVGAESLIVGAAAYKLKTL